MSEGIRIRAARLVDPAQNIDRVGDLLIRRGRIVSENPNDACAADTEVDAAGCVVTPGLIDFHSHLAHWMADTGVHPDLMCLPNGITAAADAGSVGTANAAGFIRHTIANSAVTIKLFLNVAAIGVTTERHNENPDPDLFDGDAILRLRDEYRDHIIGLKIRLGRGFSDGLGVRSLVRAKRIAEEAGLPLCVHYTNGELPLADVLELLETSDILCHCFQGRGPIILKDGQISEAVRAARKRGVIFDAAVGRINYDLSVVRAALSQNFPPDVISTDTVASSVYGHKLFHLLYTMSMFLNLGMSLPDVVRAASATPARLMGLGDEIGSLRPGSIADIAVLRLREREMTLTDQYGHSFTGNLLLVPMATIKRGRIVYKQIDFEF